MGGKKKLASQENGIRCGLMPDAMQPTSLKDDDQDDRRVGRSRSGISGSGSPVKTNLPHTMLAMD